jgi:hypothetical protein
MKSICIVMEDDFPEGLPTYVCEVVGDAVEFIKANYSEPYWENGPFIFEYEIGARKPMSRYDRNGNKYED